MARKPTRYEVQLSDGRLPWDPPHSCIFCSKPSVVSKDWRLAFGYDAEAGAQLAKQGTANCPRQPILPVCLCDEHQSFTNHTMLGDPRKRIPVILAFLLAVGCLFGGFGGILITLGEFMDGKPLDPPSVIILLIVLGVGTAAIFYLRRVKRKQAGLIFAIASKGNQDAVFIAYALPPAYGEALKAIATSIVGAEADSRSTPPSEPIGDVNLVRAVHRWLEERRASKCSHCAIIQTPPVASCSRCGNPTEETSAMFRFYIERVAYIGFLLLVAYSAIVWSAIATPETFEPVLLIAPLIGIGGGLFCLNYLGMPVPFKGLFEIEHLPKWAETPFSWKRFFMEFVYTALIWLAFAAIAFARAMPQFFK